MSEWNNYFESLGRLTSMTSTSAMHTHTYASCVQSPGLAACALEHVHQICTMHAYDNIVLFTKILIIYKLYKKLYTLQRAALNINIKLGLATRFHTSAISYYTCLAMCILDCCQLVMCKMVAYGNRTVENKMATRAP